ncbi:MAG: M23 family metallopeptidase, partial [Lachnospiraceae bacterium]|nr:M23 family metallopeptidase [Lachnospiraceae bacterium]
ENINAETGTDMTDKTDASTDLLAGVPADGGAHYDMEIQYRNPCPSYTRISDSFGVRTNPVTGEQRAHNGIDFAAEKGADVLAAADGTVYQTGFDADNGNYVILYHVLSGEDTYYTHCQEILVTEGESVTAGQKIAAVGSTGQSTGSHLHFALSRDGEYIEPVLE